MMAKLPANFTASALAQLDRVWELAGVLTTTEGARAAMQANLSRSLHAGELGTVPLAHIVAMADAGHEPAQRALAEYIATFIDEDRFPELPVGLRDYAKRVMIRRELPGYSRGHKIIDTWTRDAVISFLVVYGMENWRLKKRPAASLAATMLKRRGERPASTRQVLDIYENRTTLGERLVKFMLAEISDEDPDDDPPKSAV